MGNIISLSISNEDKEFLKEFSTLSPSKVFRQALGMVKRKEEFLDVYCLDDYYQELKRAFEKIGVLQKEIERRNERISSLQDVLAQKEILKQ